MMSDEFRRHVQLIRKAFLRAVMEAEEARTRAAYAAKPDSEREADDWSGAEEFRKSPGGSATGWRA